MRSIAIPAHVLAITTERKLDERRQRAVTRYYHAAGAGGVAVGVHTTQFEIRLPQHRLYQPLLAFEKDVLDECDRTGPRKMVRVAGIIGKTQQAVAEAQIAAGLGYHAGLLSLAALKDASVEELIAHCRAVAEIIPLIGFYLQPAAGGRLLSYDFWRRFAEIPNSIAIKMAPFNRYQTLDVLRGVAESSRANEIALYTGNDDNIVVDLLTQWEFQTGHGLQKLNIVGGLLGHWACWTSSAVEILEKCRALREQATIPAEMLTLAAQVTDANAAFFDAAHNYAGCIAGVHEVLRRAGLLANNYCLNPNECLSPGQAEEIERVTHAYPHLCDDEFIKIHLDEWLA